MSAVLTEPSAGPVVTREQVQRAPKVLLHDHLDGGLRPVDDRRAGREIGHALPASGCRVELGEWFTTRPTPARWSSYLETFDHTVAVMQTASALHRVAAECAEDLAADGVVYAEVRYAPGAAPHRGADAATRSSRRCWPGFADGRRMAADRPIRVGTLLTAMRHAARSPEIAELSMRVPRPRRGRLRHRRRRGRLPAHPAPGRVRVPAAGELPLHDPRRRGVRAAVDLAGDPVVRRGPARPRRPHRRRHLGRRGRPVSLGRLAAYVRDKRIPLEMCPSSNVQTGAAAVDRRAPDRAAARPAVPGHGQHRQPADERHLDDRGRCRAWSRRSATASATCSGSPSTR